MVCAVEGHSDILINLVFELNVTGNFRHMAQNGYTGDQHLSRVHKEELPARLQDPEPLLNHLLAHRPAEQYFVSTDGE